MEGIIFLILMGALIVEVLATIVIIAWLAFTFLMDKWYDWEIRSDEKYTQICREWFEKGNCILKTKNMTLKITFILTYYNRGPLGVCCYGEKCYKFNLSEVEIGRIISKRSVPLLHKIKGNLEDTTKEKFVDELLCSDSILHRPTGTTGYVFSFDTVDMSLLPDWITMELVAKKLAES